MKFRFKASLFIGLITVLIVGLSNLDRPASKILSQEAMQRGLGGFPHERHSLQRRQRPEGTLAQRAVQEAIASNPSKIVVNQIGYLPQWQKTAFLLNNHKPTSHPQLIDRHTRKVVKTIQPGKEIQDTATLDAISTIDFSDITQPGTYYLRQGKRTSAPFNIGTDIYQQPLITLLRSYYSGVQVY